MIETRELGRTGVTVTRIGLGMAALGRPGYMVLGHAHDLAGRTSELPHNFRTETRNRPDPTGVTRTRSSVLDVTGPH